MHRFRVPEIFLGCFLTVAMFAMGVLFAIGPNSNPSSNHISAPATNHERQEKQAESEPSWWSVWLLHDAAGFFTFGLVVVGIAQAFLFFIQLRYMRKGMNDATIAAFAARDAALAAIEANELNRKNAVAERRAWLKISDVKLIGPTSFKEDGIEYRIQFTVENIGRTVARSAWLGVKSYYSDHRMDSFAAARSRSIELAKRRDPRIGENIFPGDHLLRGHGSRDTAEIFSYAIRELGNGERRLTGIQFFITAAYDVEGGTEPCITHEVYGSFNIHLPTLIEEGRWTELSQEPFLPGIVT